MGYNSIANHEDIFDLEYMFHVAVAFQILRGIRFLAAKLEPHITQTLFFSVVLYYFYDKCNSLNLKAVNY